MTPAVAIVTNLPEQGDITITIRYLWRHRAAQDAFIAWCADVSIDPHEVLNEDPIVIHGDGHRITIQQIQFDADGLPIRAPGFPTKPLRVPRTIVLDHPVPRLPADVEAVAGFGTL